jgi:hypothetical protein
MLKNLSRLEAVINDKTYHFYCDVDSQIQHAKAALFQFLGYINQVEEAAKAQQEEKSDVPVESKVEPLDPLKEKNGDQQ